MVDCSSEAGNFLHNHQRKDNSVLRGTLRKTSLEVAAPAEPFPSARSCRKNSGMGDLPGRPSVTAEFQNARSNKLRLGGSQALQICAS